MVHRSTKTKREYRGTTGATVAERFENMGRPDRRTGCRMWQGGVDPDGYGIFWNGETSVRAHRWALERKLGRPLKPGMQSCHTCDTPGCVADAHLYEGTNSSNMKDRAARGRHPRKLTPTVLDAAVVRLRAETYTAVARDLGVHPDTLSKAVRGSHV